MESITDEKYIALICNGEFKNIHDITIGELFESFFDNINYNVVKTDDKIFVDFTGEAMCDEEPCAIIIRFDINYKTDEFELAEVKVNDEILNQIEIKDLLEDIAYLGGATVDSECNDCESGECSACSHFCFDDYIDDDENEEDDNDEE